MFCVNPCCHFWVPSIRSYVLSRTCRLGFGVQGRLVQTFRAQDIALLHCYRALLLHLHLHLHLRLRTPLTHIRTMCINWKVSVIQAKSSSRKLFFTSETHFFSCRNCPSRSVTRLMRENSFAVILDFCQKIALGRSCSSPRPLIVSLWSVVCGMGVYICVYLNGMALLLLLLSSHAPRLSPSP